MEIILLRTPEGGLTFTFKGDDRLQGVFKEYEQLIELTEEQHSTVLNMMNSCEWNKKIDFIDGKITEINRYSEEDEIKIINERKERAKINLFNSEKLLATKIVEDFNLELEDISEDDVKSVRTYIKSIKPSQVNTLEVVKRPAIMFKYDEIIGG